MQIDVNTGNPIVTAQNQMDAFESLNSKFNADYQGKDCTFTDIEEISKQLMDSLPKLDYQKIREEMYSIRVEIFENPTTFQISEGMQKVQMYKDRLAEIYTLADREHTIRKRIVEMLFDANQAVSKQSSVDKRKGEASIRWPTYIINMTLAEAFKNEVNTVINNLRSKGDMLSRQASILDMQIKLGEYRRQNGEAEEYTAGNYKNVDYKSGVASWDMLDDDKNERN